MISGSLTQATTMVEGRLHGPDRDFKGVSIDTRRLSAGELFVALGGDRFDGHAFVGDAKEKGAAGALVEQVETCELPQIEVQDSRASLGSLSRRWREQYELPVVGVTGSNGKTTVKEMLASIFSCAGTVLATRGNLNNDIGVPLTLLRLEAGHRYAVIEMGANHFGEIAYLTSLAQPAIGVITNAAPAHLEGFGDLDGVARAKGELIEGLPHDGTAVINADDDYAPVWRSLAGERPVLTFAREANADVRAHDVQPLTGSESTGSNFRLTCSHGERSVRLSLAGLHNVSNALAAAASALAAGAGLDAIAEGLSRVTAVGGRLNLIERADGVCVVDDSYNANPSSLEVAMDYVCELGGAAWLVLGDMGELGDEAGSLHADTGEQAKARGFQRLFTVGPLAANAAKTFGDGAEAFATAGDLITSLENQLVPGVTVLVKASRRMQFETVVEALTDACLAKARG